MSIEGEVLADPPDGRLAHADVEKVIEIVLDPATPRHIDPRSRVVGVTAAVVAERAGFGRTTSAKNRAIRYLDGACKLSETIIEVSAGQATTRGVRLWGAA